MSNLHPVMQAALAPFVVRGPMRVKKPLQYIANHRGVVINCELDFEPGERQTYTDPGCSASAALVSAKVGGIDIIELLDSEQIEEIEASFVHAIESAE